MAISIQEGRMWVRTGMGMTQSKMAIADYPAHSRSIYAVAPFDTHRPKPVFLQMPNTRFLIGFTGIKRLQWNGHLFVWGSLKPFSEDNAVGFPLPLPHIANTSGLLTCRGTMPLRTGKTLEALVDRVVADFWSSGFLDNGLPLPATFCRKALPKNGEHADISWLKGKELKVYKKLSLAQVTFEEKEDGEVPVRGGETVA